MSTSKIISHIKKNWFLLFLASQPILDVISFWCAELSIPSISLPIRAVLIILLTMFCFFKNKNNKYLWMFFATVLGFYILHALNSIRVGDINLITDFLYYMKVAYFPIITFDIYLLIKNKLISTDDLKKGIFINVSLIFIIVAISHLTGTAKLTYLIAGVNGWFANTNTQSLILVATIPMFFYLTSKLKYKSAYYLGMIISFFLLYFNGTLGAYSIIIPLLLLGFYLLIKNRQKNIFKYLFVTSLLLVSIFGFKYSICYQIKKRIDTSIIENENSGLNETEKPSDEQIVRSYSYSELIDIYGYNDVFAFLGNEINYSKLADNRIKKQAYANLIFNHEDTLTKTVGFEFTKIDKYKMDLENDFSAIYYYYGYLGFALYLSLFIYFIFHALIKIKNNYKVIFEPEFLFMLLTLGALIVGAEYSGAILRNPSASIYLGIMLVLIRFYKVEKRIK